MKAKSIKENYKFHKIENPRSSLGISPYHLVARKVNTKYGPEKPCARIPGTRCLNAALTHYQELGLSPKDISAILMEIPEKSEAPWLGNIFETGNFEIVKMIFDKFGIKFRKNQNIWQIESFISKCTMKDLKKIFDYLPKLGLDMGKHTSIGTCRAFFNGAILSKITPGKKVDYIISRGIIPQLCTCNS